MAAKTKSTKKTAHAVKNGMPTNDASDVMTLAEAAAFLRVSEEDVVSAVRLQKLPGREFKGQWRFLKSSLRAWLATPPEATGNEALLALVGAWKDDPFVEEELKEIYRRRGRSMTEDGE